MPAAAFCLIFGAFMALFGAMLVGASRKTYTVSAYAQAARSLGRLLVPTGLVLTSVGLVFLGVVVVQSL
jgi:hypothetical protein